MNKLKPIVLALGMSVAYAQHVTLKDLALAKADNYPCASIDPGSCTEHADPAQTFQSVRAYTMTATAVLPNPSTVEITKSIPVDNCAWCGKSPQ
jgi:hypothetical protein